MYCDFKNPCFSGSRFHTAGSMFCRWKTVRACRCTPYTGCIVNEPRPGLSGWFVQDDVSAVGEGGLGEHAEDEVTHTRFSSHSSRNCWNFWDISSWALPTALRIFPMTAERRRHTCTRARTHTGTCTRNSQCNYSQSAAYCRHVAAPTDTLHL